MKARNPLIRFATTLGVAAVAFAAVGAGTVFANEPIAPHTTINTVLPSPEEAKGAKPWLPSIGGILPLPKNPFEDIPCLFPGATDDGAATGCDPAPQTTFQCSDYEGGRFKSQEFYLWWLENCGGLTCGHFKGIVIMPGDAMEWYVANCPQDYTCDGEVGRRIREDIRIWREENCAEPECDDCNEDVDPGCTEDCEPSKEPVCETDCEPTPPADGCTAECEPATTETCEQDCDEGTPNTEQVTHDEQPATEAEEPSATEPEATPAVSYQPQAPLPPSAGAGQLFATGTQGFGLASIALVVLGGALAGTLLRRKA